MWWSRQLSRYMCASSCPVGVGLLVGVGFMVQEWHGYVSLSLSLSLYVTVAASVSLSHPTTTPTPPPPGIIPQPH